MNLFLPKVYPITDTRITGLSHRAQVEKLIAGGATFIQLREKYAAPEDFYNAAEDALHVARKHGVKIIINDRVDIALALEADGVHLGQADLPPERARKILGENAIIGLSTHNLRQVSDAVELPIDYLAVGPVFTTRTKENPETIVGIEIVEKAREAIGKFPLVAIGGITAKNFREVLNAGADSTAIISDLLSDADNIEAKLKTLLHQAISF